MSKRGKGRVPTDKSVSTLLPIKKIRSGLLKWFEEGAKGAAIAKFQPAKGMPDVT